MNLTVQWRDGTRTVIPCIERRISGGSLVLRTADGLADVVVLRGLFRIAWPAGSE